MNRRWETTKTNSKGLKIKQSSCVGNILYRPQSTGRLAASYKMLILLRLPISQPSNNYRSIYAHETHYCSPNDSFIESVDLVTLQFCNTFNCHKSAYIGDHAMNAEWLCVCVYVRTHACTPMHACMYGCMPVYMYVRMYFSNRRKFSTGWSLGNTWYVWSIRLLGSCITLRYIHSMRRTIAVIRQLTVRSSFNHYCSCTITTVLFQSVFNVESAVYPHGARLPTFLEQTCVRSAVTENKFAVYFQIFACASA